MYESPHTDTKILLPPSEALLRLRLETFSKSSPNVKQNEDDTSRQMFFGIRFNYFGLLLDEQLDKTVIRQSAIRTIPNSPTWLSGFSTICGAVTPVLNLQRLFGVKNEASNERQTPLLLALNTGHSTFALPLHQFPEQLCFSKHERQLTGDFALAPRRLKPFIDSCYQDTLTWFSIRYHEFLNHLKNCP